MNNPFEEVVWDLFGEEVNELGLPPGFRFHPTDEELVTFYLASKVFNGGLCGLDIVEVDLNRCEPWELPDVAKMGEREWYFFSLRDRKYPTGLRTNRATGAGYWKATGKDREVRAAANGSLVGMKKTLVFYKGRAPRGEKTKWVLHEYRLEGDYSCRHSCKEEWVICRIFNKSTTSGAEHKKNLYYPDPNYYYNLNLGPPPSSSPTSSCLLPPLPQLQSIESSLPQNHNTTTSPLLPLPQSLIKYDPSSSLTLQEEEEGADPFTNWLDAYYYDMLPFGGPAGGGASSHDYVSSIF